MEILRKFGHRGSDFNKVQICEVEEEIKWGDNEFLKTHLSTILDLISSECGEYAYVSNGFIRGLETSFEDIQEDEWHHFFKKDGDDHFIAYKLSSFSS